MTHSFSHLGICVSDLERSLRFYCEGLGFEPVASHQVGDEFAALMEVEGVRLESRMLCRDGVTIELLGFEAPATTGDGTRRPMNQLGLTHLSLRVDDVDGLAATIEAWGARWSAPPGPRSTCRRRPTRLPLLHRSRRRPDRAHGPARLTRGTD